jgi:hypothetical protein
MTSLVYQFSDYGILIKSIGACKYEFAFNGTEEQFVQALEKVMAGYGYVKQNEDWFPGNPSGDGDMYYLEHCDEEGEIYIAFDWVNKEFHLT